MSEEGLDIDALFNHRKTTGSILNFPGAKNLNINSDALEMECDILIPAALENVINADNAPRVKAKIIGEAANGPLTPEADEILIKYCGGPFHEAILMAWYIKITKCKGDKKLMCGNKKSRHMVTG